MTFDSNDPADGFMVKMNPGGNGTADLLYATYFGGSSFEYTYDLAADAVGNVYVTGATFYDNFPTTTDAFATSYAGNGDAFVIGLNPSGNGQNDLLYGTYLGGSDTEYGYGIDDDGRGNIYVAGYTQSADFPTTYGSYNAGNDTFIVKFSFWTPPINIEVLDLQGTPVSTLATNAEGWPTPNPLEVRMTFTNTTSANLPDPLLALEINSPFAPGLENEREGRFYVLDENGFGGGDEFPHLAQYRKVVEPGAMTPGQVKTISATLWVQPSVTTTLDIKAEFYADSLANDLLGEDTALVDVPLAEIHPVVLMPGFLGSFPPGPDGLPDPLMQTYDNMLAALRQAGYEPGQGWFSSEYDPQYAGSGATLLAFGYDWRNPLGETGQTVVKDYIDQIINTPVVDQKPYVNYNQVTIVAHSTGGLISRAYIESSEANKNTVNKLITLGTPHEGSLAAYRAWYGGDPTGIIRDIEMFRALLGLFAWCEVNNTQYTDSSIPEIYALMTEDYYNYFRARVPSATDFMPRANYVPTPYLQALPVLPAPLLCNGQNNYTNCQESQHKL